MDFMRGFMVCYLSIICGPIYWAACGKLVTPAVYIRQTRDAYRQYRRWSRDNPPGDSSCAMHG